MKTPRRLLKLILLVVFLTQTQQVYAVTSITTDFGPFYGIAVGTKLYINNSIDSTVSAIDTTTDTVVASIPVGQSPYGSVTVGKKVYVNNLSENSISVIDTTTNTVTATIPVGLEFSAVAGKKIYTSTGEVIDTTTDTVVATVAGGGFYHAITVGTKIYASQIGVGNVIVIDTTTDTVVATIPVPGGVNFLTSLGDRVYVTTTNSVAVINTTTNTVVANIANVYSLYPVTTLGTKIYVFNNNDCTVSTIDSNTNTVAATMQYADPLNNNGGDCAYFQAIVGNKIYVTIQGQDSIAVFDTSTNTVTDVLPVGDVPTQAILVGSKIYVTNSNSNQVSVIDSATLPSLLPNLTSFSTSVSSAAYYTGQSIPITAHFGRTLQTGSTMTILLNTGRSVTLNQVSGTTLSGTYTIQSGDSTSDLAVRSITSATVSDTNGHTRTSYDIPASVGTFTAENSFITRNLGDTKNISINQTPVTLDTGSHPYQLTAPINGYLYVANQGAGTVSVIDAATGALAQTISVGSEPYGLAAVSVSGTTYVYVANTNSDTVSVINTSTNTVAATIAVGVKPYYVAAVGTKVYVTNGASNTVTVINANTNTVSGTIAVGAYPRGIKAHGTDLYVANYGDSNYSGGNYISVIDSTTDTVTGTIITPGGSDGPRGVTVLGSKVYVANFRSNNVSVIDTNTNTVSATISVGRGPRGVLGTGTTLYVENFDDGTISVINTNTNTVTKTVDVGSSPAGMSISGTDLYITAFQDDKVYVLDTVTNTLKVTVDTTAPTLAEVTPVPSSTSITTPSYTFSTDEDGTITYGGSCTSASNQATAGNNTITFTALTPGTYTNCTLTVTDAASNSTTLSISPFTITGSGGGANGSSGSGYTTGCLPDTNGVVGPCLPNTTPTTAPDDCTASYLFSPTTGAPCPRVPSTSAGNTALSSPIVRTLKLGMTGPDVRTLQIYLNTHGFVLAGTGAGSPRNETTLFGTRTKAAVIKFQIANKLKGDGIVGPMTRGLMK